MCSAEMNSDPQKAKSEIEDTGEISYIHSRNVFYRIIQHIFEIIS